MTTIDFTEAQLRQFSPKMQAGYLAALLAGKKSLRKAGILDNGQRLSHFMGQFGGETNGGVIGRESLTYTTVAAIRSAWKVRASKHTDAWIKANLLRKPIELGDWAYGGRMGNRKGTSDGYDYRGGGFLQTTGRSAVEDYCRKCGIPIRPDILDDHAATLQFACVEWQESGCNELADANDLLGISKAINTGSARSNVYPNGMKNREHWFARARDIWWDAEPGEAPSPVVTASALPSPAEMAATSRKFWLLARVKQWLFGGGIATLIGGKAANDASVSDPMGLTQALFTFVKANGVYVAIGTLIVGYVIFEVIQYLMRQDKAEGRYMPSGEAGS